MDKQKKENSVAVALYIRVSTEEQAKHGYSLEAQRESLISYCKENNYKIHNFYVDEGKTARSKLNKRISLLQMLEDAKMHYFDKILFIKLDRWFRSVADFHKVQEILDKVKVTWKATQEDYDTETTSGRLNLNIRLAIAQDEADRTGDRIKFAQVSMVANGRPITGSHGLPLGYIVSGTGKDKKVIKDIEKMHMVEDLLNHLFTYRSKRLTLIYLKDKYNFDYHYDSLRKFIKNPILYGSYRGNDNYCNSYLTKEKWEELQEIFKNYTRSINKRHEYIFSGLIKCACCGNNFAGFTHVTIKKNKTKYKYPYYRCNNSYSYKRCPNRQKVSEKVLEKFLLKKLLNIAKKRLYELEKIEQIKEVKEIDLNKIKDKLGRLTELYVEGKISKEDYNNKFEHLNKELNNAAVIKPKKKQINSLKRLLDNNPLSIYNQLNNTSKNALWKKYIDYINQDPVEIFKIEFK